MAKDCPGPSCAFLPGRVLPLRRHRHFQYCQRGTCLRYVLPVRCTISTNIRVAALSMAETPCMLVACKAEIPEERWDTPARFHEHIKRSFPAVAIQETNKNEAESQKRCLSNMLHRVFAASRGMDTFHLPSVLARHCWARADVTKQLGTNQILGQDLIRKQCHQRSSPSLAILHLQNLGVEVGHIRVCVYQNQRIFCSTCRPDRL